MSLGEFNTQLNNVKELLKHCKRIADNEDVDSIELSVLDVPADGMASACFCNTGGTTVPTTIAYREAYDFTSSHKRLMDSYKIDRAGYYSRASKELDIVKDRYNHLNAVLTRYQKKGAL